MHHDINLEAPPTCWTVLTVIGGITTGIALVIGLETLGKHLPEKNSQVQLALPVVNESNDY